MLIWRNFDSIESQAEALCAALVRALHDVLEHQPRALLALSGGTSPRALLPRLAHARLPWERIDLTLADDRWVPDSDPDSNARLLRECLRQAGAEAASWLPLVDTSRSAVEQVQQLNDHFPYRQPDVCVLGMGLDGHTASLFADAPQWPQARHTEARFVFMEPAGAPHARVSWSLAALRECGRLFLLIQGEAKRDVLCAAAELEQDNAISRLSRDQGVTLDVYWCAEA